MLRRSALAVAALLVVAGCSGVSPLPDGDSGPQTTTLADADPPYATPLDDSDLLADHAAVLREAGTFTVDTNWTVSDSQRASYAYRNVVRARPSDGAVYTTQRPAPVVQVYQFGNGTSFLRLGGDDVQYERNPETTRAARDWTRQPVSQALTLFDFRHAGVDTRDGERVHVYRASGPGSLNATAAEFMFGEGATTYAANATLRVRESGLVTFVEFAYQVGTEDRKQTVRATKRFTELGTTDVSPPAWVSTARERTGNESE